MMVLDTHVWIRWVDPTNMPLPSGLVERIETSDQLAISAISCWELAMLVRRGRVQVSLSLDRWIDMAQRLWRNLFACGAPDRHLCRQFAGASS